MTLRAKCVKVAGNNFFVSTAFCFGYVTVTVGAFIFYYTDSLKILKVLNLFQFNVSLTQGVKDVNVIINAKCNKKGA